MRIDIDRWKDQTARLDLDGIDFDAFRGRPLSEGALRCLRYMHDVEHHTICYLRDLLLTHAHKDPTVTSFLTMWCYEEYWHGEAIGQVLRAHGEPAGDSRISVVRARRRWKDRLDPLSHLLGSAVAGESYVAIHMSWGAINEWTTQAGYARLSQRAAHPVLTELLRRVMKQEGRHIDFYASQAQERLAGDARARRLTRAALRRFWNPVGATVMPSSEVAFLIQWLFGDAEGRAVGARIDRRIDRLPGLAGLRLVEGAIDRYTASAAA